MRILITAGPTREYLDAVRFLSSPSSGRMGFACAREALRRGHRVTLIAGPVDLKPPKGAACVRVESAGQMFSAVRRAFQTCDAVIMTAAVADYRPARRVSGKIKKNAARLRLDLVPTPDILAWMGRRKGRRRLVGFALEVQDARANALAKLRRKRLDLVVLNDPGTFGEDAIRPALIFADGQALSLPFMSKRDLARVLILGLEVATRPLSGRPGWMTRIRTTQRS